MKNAVIVAALLLFLLPAARAVDINVAPDETKKEEQLALAPLEGFGYYDTAALAELALERGRRSPTGAMWRSFALPGWGQLYNRQYIKAPIMMAGEGLALYMAVDNYATSRRYLREARAAGDADEKRRLLSLHGDYVVETEFWGWVFVGVMAYSMMDAYVDAHLSDWEVEELPAEKAASRVEVYPAGPGVVVSIALF